MNAEQFQKIITARADERVQKKIREFRHVALRAAYELTGVDESHYLDGFGNHTKQVFETLVMPRPRIWPSAIWRREEKLVQEELFKTMDEMQRAILAATKYQPNDVETRKEE